MGGMVWAMCQSSDVGRMPIRPAKADHPHFDPGDGRSECLPCGKWVFPAIHSCKGVPVTEAARRRAVRL